MAFLRVRKRKQPSLLKLTGNKPGTSSRLGDGQGQDMVKAEEGNPIREMRRERSLNVFFNYNGHSWDAYEVLGLPAGSSKEATDEAYRIALGKVDEESRVFIDCAYKAIAVQNNWR